MDNVKLNKCEYCGEEFEPSRNHPHQLCCSKECYHKYYWIHNKEKISRKRKRVLRESNPKKFKVKKLTRYEQGYISASIDTDGSIWLHKVKHKKSSRGWYPKIGISFTNTSIEYLNEIQRILGTNKNLQCRKFPDVGIGKKDVYFLQLSGNDCRKILPQIKLVIKERKRELAIKILTLVKKRYDKPVEYEKELENLVGEWYG